MMAALGGTSAKDTQGYLVRQIFRRLLPFWPYWLIGTLFTLAGSWAQVAIAALQKDVLDLIAAARLAELYRVLVVWGIAIALSFVVALLGWFLVNYGSALAVRAFRRETLNHVLRLPLAAVEERQSGDLVSRAHSDAFTAVGSLTGNIADVAWAVLTAILAFVYLARIHLPLTILVTVVGPLLFLAGRLFDRRIRRVSEELQKNEAAIRSLLQEDLQGMEAIRAYGLESWALARFAALRQENKALSLKLALTRNFLWIMNGVTYLLISILASAAVALVAIAGNLTAGSLLAFVILVNRLTGPFAQVSNSWGNLQQALGAARRVFEILRLPTEPVAESRAVDADMLVGDAGPVLEFERVTFAYPGNPDGPPLLSDISFQVKPGEMVGLVGESGAGKSTIARLALGLYWPVKGSVRVYGYDTQTHLEQARAMTAYVPQRSYLFGGTVAENVTCGHEAGLTDEVMAGLGLDRLLVELPQGESTVVGEQGAQLSGGQRQRVAIARALLRRPRLLVLDEATSSLDNETEASIKQLLGRVRGKEQAGMLVIAHRLTTVVEADRILVLKDGRVVEEGTHEELMQRGGEYARLWEAGK